MGKWVGFIRLARPINVLIAVASIFLATFISKRLEPMANVILACLAGALVTAGANAINDYFDLEIDRINKPKRPLPSGQITPTQTLIFAWSLLCLGLLTSVMINFLAASICFFSVILLYFYSAIFKRVAFWGNWIVSIVTGSAFIYGSAAVGKWQAGVFPAVFAFFMHWGREIVKDMQDVKGDAAQQAKTLPILYGMEVAKRLVSIVFVILMLITWLPFLLNFYSEIYIIIVLIGIYPILILTIYMLYKHPTSRALGYMSGWLKADMVIGLGAILLGS
jgi:geranylgeranylglycerol-phosphate geranylgeranyltransferase